jgi:tripartite-type tricarboxylate transporter receptor subunit TctC
MKKWEVLKLAIALTVGAAAGVPVLAAAQDGYPNKPIRVVVPFLAGGSIDLVIRLVSNELTNRLGKPIIVENKAGAGGSIGAEMVAKAAPDGYTFLFTAQGPLATTPFLIAKLPYDAQTAFDPVSIVTSQENVLIVHPSLPFRTVQAFIEYAKANPGKLTYGSQGIGTTGHLTGAMVNQQAGVDLVHIPYKGFPPLLADLQTGRVQMMFADMINALPRIRSREVVPIAVSSERRSAALPNVQTFAEAGYPELISEPYFALYAPAGTPPEIRRRWAGEIQEALKVPSVAAKLQDLGVQARGTSPEVLGDYMKKEYARWGRVIRAAGMTPER